MDKIRSLTARNEWAWTFEKGLSHYRLTRGNVLWALACAYTGDDWGYLTFDRIKANNASPLAHERLECLHDYFERVESCCDMNEIVEYELVKQGKTYRHHEGGALFGAGVHVNVHAGRMEEMTGAIVDFANANLHIHSVIGSVTQEELLFSICSECFLALALFPKTLEDDECVIFRNVWNHASYEGYDKTFRFTGPLTTNGNVQRFHTIIAMDACESDQFMHWIRDCNKAYLGFVSVEETTVSTGNWGCGAFGGDMDLKFLQQILAAQWAGKQTLHYSMFGSEKNVEKYTRLLGELRKCTCDWIMNLMESYNPFSGMSFPMYLRASLMERELTQ